MVMVGSALLPCVVRGTGEGVPARFTFQTFFIADEAVSRAVLPPLFYQRGNRFLPLNLVPNSLGLRHVFEGPLPFAFYIEETNEENETVYRQVAVLNKTFAGSQPGPQLIVVKPEPGRLDINAIPIGADNLEAGKILVLNAGPRDVAIRAGETDPVVIGKGAARMVDYLRGSDYRFRLLVASENGSEGWELVHSSMVTQVRERPLMLVVYPHGSSTHSYNVRFIPLGS